MKNNRPMFSVGEFSETELSLIKKQEPVLKKLDSLGYGIYVEEGYYLPIPTLLTEGNFPLNLYYSCTDEKITVQNWDEFVALSD